MSKFRSPGIFRKIFFLCIILASGIISSCYDDSELVEQLKQVEQRVSNLETLMKAVQSHDMISSIVPVDNGYLITFKDAGLVTLLNGKNGTNGKDGKDGKDGADGKDGKDGDAFFKTVEIGETSVHIVMEDGKTFDIPLYNALSIAFPEGEKVTIHTSSSIDLRYEVSSNIKDITIEVLCSGNVKAKVENPHEAKGYINIQIGDEIDEYTKVVVLVTNGEKMVMKTITFDKANIRFIETSDKHVSSDGGNVVLEYLSNVECTVKVSKEGESWISVLNTKALTAHEITLYLKPNEGRKRSATVKVISGDLSISFTITQEKNPDCDDEISVDGEIKELQHHTKGNGIPFILTGDVFNDDDVASGYFDETIRTAMEHIFEVEPYKTFRDYFDVYSICAVSRYGGRFYGTYYGNGTFIGGDHEKVMEMAQKAVSDISEATVMVVINEKVYAGTCWMYYPPHGDYGNGLSIAYLPIGYDDNMFGELIHHEFGGHGFPKLGDEYFYSGYAPQSVINEYEDKFWPWGWYLNIATSPNPQKAPWAKFLQDSRYDGLGLGLYEGAGTYEHGLYRSTEISIMFYNTGEYNPISRECIYKRIHKLGISPDWQYDYEEFVKYDEINRKAYGSTYKPVDMNTFVPLHPPIIMSMK